MWGGVTEYIQDGNLGLPPTEVEGSLLFVGVSDTGEAETLYYIDKNSNVRGDLGLGPLPTKILDALAVGSEKTKIVAVKATSDVAGSRGEVTHTGTGSATEETSGNPKDEYQFLIEIVTGGELADAVYKWSRDGGRHWSGELEFGGVGAVVLGDTGVTITFTEGTPPSFVAGDTYAFNVTAPDASLANKLTALNWAIERVAVEGIVILGESDAAAWASFGTWADTKFTEHRPMFMLLESTAPADGEALATWVTARVTERATYSHVRVSVVAMGANITDADGNAIGRNGIGLVAGTVSKIPTMRSMGNVMEAPQTPAVALYPVLTTAQIKTLDDNDYITFRRYVGLENIFITDGHVIAAATSDYQKLETRRVVDKSVRLCRVAALRKVHSETEGAEGDESGLKDLENHLEQALERMKHPVREITNYGVVIPEGQDIIGTSEVQVQLSMVPVPIMRKIILNFGLAVSL